QVALHVIWELLMLIRMHRKGSDGREQKRMVVVGGREGGNRNETVAARTILHQHRLAPAAGQSVCEQSRRNVRSAGGSEWQDEPARPVGIDLRGRAGEVLYIAKTRDGRKEKHPYHSNAPSQNAHSVASDGDSGRQTAVPSIAIAGSASFLSDEIREFLTGRVRREPDEERRQQQKRACQHRQARRDRMGSG